MSKQQGPTVKISYSCFECTYCTSERYRCQGDSGSDVYCEHPDFKEKKSVGDTNWSTPDFCPYKKEAFRVVANEV